MSPSARLPLPCGIPATDTETEQEILKAIEAASGRQEQWGKSMATRAFLPKAGEAQ
jgi:hypothetical protein